MPGPNPSPPRAARAPWRAIAAVSVATLVAGRLGHGLLFREWLDRPLILAGWLIAGVVAGAVLLRVLTGRWPFGADPDERRIRIGLAALGVVLLAGFHFHYLGVASDGRDYFVQARSIVFDGDLDITPEEIAVVEAPGQAVHYPVGSAILWSPVLAATHVYVWLLEAGGHPYPAGGLGGPYEVAVGLATLMYGFVGLVLTTRVLARLFTPGLALLATIATAGGTFVLWYLVVEASMSHGASLFAVSLFLWLWLADRTGAEREDRTARRWAALGAAAGLMTIVRWQNVLFAAVLVPEIAAAWWRAGRDVDRRWQILRTHALAALAGLAVVSPQLWLWHRNSDGWLAVPAERFTVNWFDPVVTNVIFSPLHGLTTWSPLLYLSLVGLAPLVWRRPRIGALLVLGLAGQLYANSTLEVWWGGSSFGARRFAGCTLVFAAGLAALLDWGRRRPLAAATLMLAPFVLINVLLVGQARYGGVSIGGGITAGDLLRPAYGWIGNPFSFPASLAFALEHDVPLSTYDRIGTRVYQRLRIDVGTADDDPFLTYGWSAAEGLPGGTYRWALGEAAGVAVPLSRRAPYRVGIVAEPFVPPDGPPARLRLVVNGVLADEVELEPRLAAYDLTVPEAALRPNLNHFRFEFSTAASPRAHGLSPDDRLLAVAFHEIDIARR